MIIVKKSESVQLSHLYEHLYCNSVDYFFRSKNLFRHIDYSLSGTTYTKGAFSVLDITFYTKKAAEFKDDISHLDISLDDTNIGLGISQIVAETKLPLASPGISKIQKALMQLHLQPWLDVNDIDIINVNGTKLKTDILATGEGSRQRTRSLVATILLKSPVASAHPELLPLFTQLTECIIQNSKKEVMRTYGLYGISDKKAHSDHGLKLPYSFDVPPHATSLIDNYDDLKKILFIFLDSIRDLHESKAYERLLKQLRGGSYDTISHFMPSLEPIVKDTSLFIGKKGWERTATADNFMLLLDNTTIEIRYGRKKRSLEIRKLLEQLS